MGIVRVTSASPFSGRVHGVKDRRVGVFTRPNLLKFTGIIHLASFLCILNILLPFTLQQFFVKPAHKSERWWYIVSTELKNVMGRVWNIIIMAPPFLFICHKLG
jgi:hypothetical protein